MKPLSISVAALLCTSALLAPRVARAQATPPEDAEPTPATPAAPAPALAPALAPAPALALAPAPAPAPAEPAYRVTPLGYVEAHYAYNLNRPSNGITNFRGFDNRHNTFTLANAVLGASAESGPVSARIVLQYGSTPSTYYLGEPALAGTGGANASGPELWKYLQEANIAWKAPVGRGLLLQIGLVPSPIGIEAFAVKDNWNYSRSNLFFGLPFYHAGLRATYEWTDELSSTFAVFNGWNSVVDNNEEKSVQTNLTYKIPQKLVVQALYFGGVERPAASRPEGPWWRHDFDLSAQYHATPWLSVMAQGNHGWEPNRIGTARWTAGAVYARMKPLALFERFAVSSSDRLYLAVRGDRFHEHLATDGRGRSSSPLFWGGVEWVSSVAGTVDVRPHDNLSVRLEYRHDMAGAPLFFGRNVRGDGSAAASYIPNARTQDTLLLGATAWF